MTECKHCGRRAQLFLCELCIAELRDMLHGLARGRKRNGRYGAGWLEHLAEAALGQTRLGEAARRTPRYRQRMDGDKPIAAMLEPFPDDNEQDLAKARRQREKAALQHALGAAKINLRASELLEQGAAALFEWVRDICETRGVEIPALNQAADTALWLAQNVTAIASDEGAAVCYKEVAELVKDIEQVINRPIPPRFVGPCPIRGCGAALNAPKDAKEVTCWSCKNVHNVDDVIQKLWAGCNQWLLTTNEIHMVMEYFGEPVPAGTIRRWKTEGRLKVRGWRDGKPRYWAEDVRRLRNGDTPLEITAV